MGQAVLSHDKNLSEIYKEKNSWRNHVENLLEDNIVQMVLYLDISLLKIFVNVTEMQPYLCLIKNDYIYLSGEYGSTSIASG